MANAKSSGDQKGKRQYGTGMIRKRPDGTFEGRYQNRDYNNGKQKSVYGKSEAEVKRKLKELDKALKSQSVTEIPKKTVEQYMTHWLIATKKNELKEKSYDRLEITVKHQIIPHIGNIQIANLSYNDTQNLVNKLFDQGLSYSTVKKAYDAVNSCFKNGVIKGDIPRNPALGVTLNARKKKPKSDIKFFTEDEVKELNESAISRHANGKLKYRLGPAITLVLNTGLRIGELLALKWTDVDFTLKTVQITNSMVQVVNRDEKIDKKYVLLDQSSTKSESGQRILHLNSSSIEALQELQKETGDMKYILSSSTGHPISPRNMDRLIRNLCRISGFTEERTLSMHALRHTFASRLFAKGVDAKVVSEILGHSDVQITYNTYIHLIDSQKKHAIEIIDIS